MGNRLAKAAASLGYAAASSEERSGALRMTRGAVVLKRRKIAPPLLAWAELLLAAADDDEEACDGDGGGSTTYAPPSQSNYGAGECSFMYRYIVRESCSQFDSLPLTSLTIKSALMTSTLHPRWRRSLNHRGGHGSTPRKSRRSTPRR